MKRFLKGHPFILAVATLVGMIIGAGTFGIPYAFSQAGIIVGLFYLILLGAAVMTIHLIYGEIILRTEEPCRWVGCVERYQGPVAKKLVTPIVFFQYYGSMLAYIILGGDFLQIIFGRFFQLPESFWVLLFFLIAGLGIWRGIKTVGPGEIVMLFFMVLAIAFLSVKSLPLIKVSNFIGENGWVNIFLPYGVLFFALTGSAAVPEMRQILKGRERQLKSAIFLGTLIPIIFYFLFALLIVGVTGQDTSQDAISGLVPHLGQWAVIIGAIFGIFAILSSFLVLGVNMKESFNLDFDVKKRTAFILTMAVPLFLYFIGLKGFIFVIGFIGAVFSGLDGIFMIFIYFNARKKGDRKPEYFFPKFKFLGATLVLVFSFGLIYQLIYFLK